MNIQQIKQIIFNADLALKNKHARDIRRFTKIEILQQLEDADNNK